MYMYVHVCGWHGNSDLNINDSFPLSFLQILHTRIHLRSIVLKHVMHMLQSLQWGLSRFCHKICVYKEQISDQIQIKVLVHSI